MRKLLTLAALLLAIGGPAQAQVGSLIWEDDFDDLNHWLKVTGNGSWGWGNGELEYYKNENVDVAAIPGEPGNNALRIVAKQESGPGIVDQWGNPLNYTSGKVVTKSFVTVKYGMIETRVLVPNLNLGGWPAVWMLGTANVGWPGSGEVDLMEMGASKAFRDLHDTHNGGNGLNNSTVNQMVGANAIWQSPSAVGPGNPLGAASLANDPTDVYDRPYYNYANPLNGRFLIYRLYWDEDSMRFTVVDDGVEHDLYASPFVFGSDADGVPRAVLPDREPRHRRRVHRLLPPGRPGQRPADLDAAAGDDVRGLRARVPVERPGRGRLRAAHRALSASSASSPTRPRSTAGLETGVTSDVYVWESTLVDGTITPYEGANVLAWQTNGKGWFGAGIMSRQPENLFDMGSGFLKFRIKIPANVTFKIGVIDSWGNQFYTQLPAHTTKYGLVRNGEWGQVTIPVSDLRGPAIDLRMLSYEFVILEESGTGCEFALDDIYWESSTPVAVDDPAAAPAAGLALSSLPNPFHGTTELRFALASALPYEVTVFDAAGKRVTTFRGIGRAGANAVRWDGRDEQGRKASAGVYHYRLVANGLAESRKVVLLD